MITIWRCTNCGKWSHAQRRPKFHQRFTFGEPEVESDILVSMQDEGGEIGYMVKCGPFDEWRAERVDGRST